LRARLMALNELARCYEKDPNAKGLWADVMAERRKLLRDLAEAINAKV